MTYKAAAFSGPAPAASRRRYSYDPFGGSPRSRPRGRARAWRKAMTPMATSSAGIRAPAVPPTPIRKGRTVSPRWRASGAKLAIGQDANGAVTGLGGLSSPATAPAGGRAVPASHPGRTGWGSPTASLPRRAGDYAAQRPGAARQADGAQRAGPLVEVDSAGRQEIAVHGPGGLVALLVDGVAPAVSRDGRGSTRVVTCAGKAVAQFDYGASVRSTAPTR